MKEYIDYLRHKMKDSAERFETYRAEATQENFNNLWAVSLLFSVLFFLFFLSSAVHEVVGESRIFYFCVLMGTVGIWNVTHFIIRKHKQYIFPMAYLFVVLLYVYGIWVGVFADPDRNAVTTNLILIAAPLLLVDRGWRISLFQVVATAVICILAMVFKNYPTNVIDCGNNAICCLFGIILSSSMNRLRLSSYAARLADYQIRPHLISNVIQSIQLLCHKDPAQAETALVDFAEYLRGSMYHPKLQGVIPIEYEMEHVRAYLSIEKLRFKERLNVVYELECGEFFLPALTVQPLVENAVRHGIFPREEGGTVTVSTRDSGRFYEISIRDDGVGFSKSEASGWRRDHVGVENVRQRIEILCGGRLELVSVPNQGTTATIYLPKTTKKKRRRKCF